MAAALAVVTIRADCYRIEKRGTQKMAGEGAGKSAGEILGAGGVLASVLQVGFPWKGKESSIDPIGVHRSPRTANCAKVRL